MQSSAFAVVDEPFCLWEVDLSARTRAFLDGIDMDYFDYVLQTHMAAEDERRALLAIRLSLHHATETLFSLLGALVQAPYCPYAWIAKCSNAALRDFVERVTRRDASLITALASSEVSWHAVAAVVFATYKPGTDRQSCTVERFAEFWTTLAGELVDQDNVDEYNALKHGFRARHGGFSLTAGVEVAYGVAPPASDLQLLGQSKFGVSFSKIEPFGKSRGPHLRSHQTSVNWSLEQVILLHQLVYMSIVNVVSALKVANGYRASECRFLRPEDEDAFLKPWSFTSGVVRFNVSENLDDQSLPVLTKSDLLAKLRAR